MAGISLRCDVVQGFNFQKDQQTPVGHITALTVSKKKLENKLTVQDPTKIDKGPAEKIVGVITNIRWNGGFAEPIIFTCQVTAKNRETIAILTHKDLSNTEVEFAFNVYEFDAGAATPKYYLSFHSNKKSLKGLVEKNGGNLEMEIDSEPSPEVVSPRNYELYLSVMPNDGKAEEVHLAVSDTAKFVKKWGVTAK
jgi:hypothetical protein